MSQKVRPFLRPPVQRTTIPYFFTIKLVRQAGERFHRYTTIKGLGKLPKGQDPIIFVSNHQNGLMDPVLISCVMKPQLHWLTRSDVFWNPVVRKILFAFNQMPIYRQRDRLKDLRERNDAIWDCCIERLETGAVLSIFPEGNHNPQRTIRDLKRGLSDLLSLAVNKHDNLKRLKVIPLGLDYEYYPGYRRRFCVRMGDPINWVDLYDEETGKVHFNKLSERVTESLRKLAIDIRPHERYDDIIPYINAQRTTEMSSKEWDKVIKNIDSISKLDNLDDISQSAQKLVDAGLDISKTRVEAWGESALKVRSKKWWAVLLRPISWLANAPTVLQQLYLNHKGDKIKAIEFRSTLKVGAGMFVYPISWTIMAVILGVIANNYDFSFLGWNPFIEIFFAFWSWATFGNRFYGWLQGHLHDHRDAIEGERFWNDNSSLTIREAWVEYIAVVKKHL